MSCERCGGFMVTEAACGCPGEPALYGSFGFRCLNCGYLDDDIMRLNRRGRPLTELTRGMTAQAAERGAARRGARFAR